MAAERIAVDEKRLKWLERRRLKNFNAAQKARIDASIARIGRRRLRWAWTTMDPTLPGSTIELERRDLQRVCEWLRSVAGVDPDALTARALDRCTWAGALFLARRSTRRLRSRASASRHWPTLCKIFCNRFAQAGRYSSDIQLAA